MSGDESADPTPGEAAGGRRTKVERVVDTYDLEGMPDRLADGWLGVGGERRSLRELAREFNTAVLRAAIEAAGESPVSGEAANYRRLLTDDEVTAGERTEARRHLESIGVDVERVTDDFLTHQAVHTYLTDRRGLSHEGRTAAERVESAIETQRRLEGRVAQVTDDTLGRLRDSGDLAIQGFDTLVAVTVVCGECGTQHEVTALLEQGGCDCQLS